MHNLAARGCFINLTKLHLTLSQSQLTLEYLGCAWVVFSDYYGQKEMFSLGADYLAMRLVVIKDNCLFRGEWILLNSRCIIFCALRAKLELR